MGNKVDPFRCTACKNDLGRFGGIDVALNTVPRSFIRLRCFFTEEMNAAMDIGIFFEIVPVHRIDRRHDARLALVRGPVQRFAADQIGCAELLACIVAAERPGRAAEAAGVLAECQSQRRSAEHILTQIRITEAAIVRLWMLRFGEDPR